MTAPTITRTMVLWCPDWPVTAAIQAHRHSPDAAIALIDKGRVFACSASSRREGVARGLRVREAQSRHPDLIVEPYEAVLDTRAFEAVIDAIEEIMPGVQLLRPGMCALRTRGPSRYYGGEEPAAQALLDRLGTVEGLELGESRVGIADGPFTAEHAARSTAVLPGAGRILRVPPGESAAFLGPLGVGLLSSPALVTLLHRLGVRTLADFAALPVTDVLQRFGEDGARLHALASGHDSRAVLPRVPPQQLDSTIEFEPALDRVDQVTFGFRASADRFLEGLTAAGLVCTAIRIEVATEAGDTSERSWLHPRSFTASDVLDRVRWQLQGGGTIDSGLRSGITRVSVMPESVDAISNHEEGLWGTGPDERIHSGLSRVQSMLGHGGVLTATIGGGRTLADRQNLIAWGDRPQLDRPVEQPWPGQLPPLPPATVFSSPHPVCVVDASGAEVSVDERGALSGAPASFFRGSAVSSAGREVAGTRAAVTGAAVTGAAAVGTALGVAVRTEERDPGADGRGAQRDPGPVRSVKAADARPVGAVMAADAGPVRSVKAADAGPVRSVKAADARPVVAADAGPVVAPDGGPVRSVKAWAGPWPVNERWWDPEHSRRAYRFQIVDADGTAWLFVLDGGSWRAEARYD
ncbi:Y-family DNA polymerase [Planctomonas psychrotolerans]|uniref:Y-family DNA polymerase n=1 Tax=Planctomonas psychrotolerans TaxID=2528712 RepID=UPI001D0D1DEA|nr:DNA polymerase Y family protein [Planctomonas psychrotolerans]